MNPKHPFGIFEDPFSRRRGKKLLIYLRFSQSRSECRLCLHSEGTATQCPESEDLVVVLVVLLVLVLIVVLVLAVVLVVLVLGLVVASVLVVLVLRLVVVSVLFVHEFLLP